MNDLERQDELEQQALALRLISRVLSVSEVLTGWLLRWRCCWRPC